MEFDPFGVSLKDLHTKAVLLRCDSTGDLYPIFSPAHQRQALPAISITKDTWHRRLGHPAVSSAFNKSFPCNQTDRLCQACQLGKHVRLPFSTSTSKTFAAFELVHCDLWTAPIYSHSNMKYYLIIIDDFSHYMWYFPLHFKSDVHDTLTNFVAYVKTHFHRAIGTIQCDNGTEFDNLSNRLFLAPHGTSLRFSCPYTSPQNGKAERAIRTINDVIRTLLIQASMPPIFWAEALSTATLLLNICPTKPLNLITPHEKLFNTTPSYDHIRVYGCLCFPNLSATTPHKLAPRSLPCVFIGYPTEHKGYRCYHIPTKRVYVSHHITFDETIFPFADGSATQSSLYKFPHPNSLPFSPGVIAPPARLPSPAPTSAAADNSLSFSAAPSRSTTSPATAGTSGASSSPAQSSPPTTPPSAPTLHHAPPPPPSRMRTRLQDGILQPKRLFNVATSSPISPIPRTYRQALADPHWSAAMRDEHNALLQNDTWTLVPKPSGANVVSGK
jgi:histone deacetylase 1/2